MLESYIPKEETSSYLKISLYCFIYVDIAEAERIISSMYNNLPEDDFKKHWFGKILPRRQSSQASCKDLSSF